MNVHGDPIYLHETPMFREWLKKNNLTWPSHPWDQENMMAQFWRDGWAEYKQERQDEPHHD